MKLSKTLLLLSVVGVAVGQQTAKIQLELGKTCIGEPDVFPKIRELKIGRYKNKCMKRCIKKARCKGIRFENRPKDGGAKCGHYMKKDVELTSALPSSDDPKYKVWCGKKQLYTVPITSSPTSVPTDVSLLPTAIPSLANSSSPSVSPSLLASAEPSFGPPPTTSPSVSPSKGPTTKPSPSPSLSQSPSALVKCSLEFKLAHKTTAIEAEYYGYHTDAMEVTKEGDNEYSCSGLNAVYFPGNQASWCDYDSTYIDEDYYGATTYYMDGDWGEAPWESDETIIVNNAAGFTYRINVKHIFQEEDYYYTSGIYYGELHYDHLMPAYLKVTNQNDNSVITPVNEENYDPRYGWHHPVSLDQSTHVEGKPNEINDEYEGNFEVAVTCDNSCSCSAEYQVV